jgi:hypothetical protein
VATILNGLRAGRGARSRTVVENAKTPGQAEGLVDLVGDTGIERESGRSCPDLHWR